jgi:hypothetical protein
VTKDKTMESALETLRAALADGATPDQRAAGATACRAMLAALEATPGQPLPVSPPLAATETPSAPPSDPPTASATTTPAPPISLAGLSLDQILDLAIGRLRTMLPPEKLATAQASQPPLFVRMFRGS